MFIYVFFKHTIYYVFALHFIEWLNLQNDFSVLQIQQTGNNPNHNTGNNEQTSICLENITPFSLTECPLLMDLYGIHKETTNSLSNQKDSACESDNLSSLNGEL